MAFEKIIDIPRLNRFKTKILNLVYQKGDVYNKNEIDNKFSQLETNIDWKEAVATYNDIATTYPNPVDGWTVNVKDTDYTYRYNGTSWVAISANAIPKATQSVDGLITKEDKTKLDGIATGAEVNQNAFSKVTVGSTTVAADSKTDTLTLVAGSNVTLTPDATNDKITITATDTNTHYASGTIVNNSTTATANTTTALTNGNVYLNHVENSAVKNSHKISGSGSTTVTSDISGNIVVTTPSDTKASTVSFTTSDVADGDATSWTSVSKLTSGITHKTFLERVSQMFKNIRYLYKMLGTTDISGIGDGTCSGAISSLNSNLNNKQDGGWTIVGEATDRTTVNFSSLKSGKNELALIVSYGQIRTHLIIPIPSNTYISYTPLPGYFVNTTEQFTVTVAITNNTVMLNAVNFNGNDVIGSDTVLGVYIR